MFAKIRSLFKGKPAQLDLAEIAFRQLMFHKSSLMYDDSYNCPAGGIVVLDTHSDKNLANVVGFYVHEGRAIFCKVDKRYGTYEVKSVSIVAKTRRRYTKFYNQMKAAHKQAEKEAKLAYEKQKKLEEANEVLRMLGLEPTAGDK